MLNQDHTRLVLIHTSSRGGWCCLKPVLVGVVWKTRKKEWLRAFTCRIWRIVAWRNDDDH
jgi:hypothetical protein